LGDPELDRRQAIVRAREIAQQRGHSEASLRRFKSRMELSNGASPREYVIEFPDHEA
jgi:hypothetical protein